MAARLRQVHQQSKQVPPLHRRPAWSRDSWRVATARTLNVFLLLEPLFKRAEVTLLIILLNRHTGLVRGAESDALGGTNGSVFFNSFLPGNGIAEASN